jgi:acyl-CoA synthetase (AMP-forming)/AMP-acid ligase II
MTDALRDVMLERAHQDPDGLAYDYGQASLTFGQLAERAADRAAALRAAGVRPGDHVALVMSSDLPFVEMFWGLQLIGGVPCSFNPDAPREAVTKRVGVVRPALVVTDDSAGELLSGPPLPRLPDIGPEDLAFLQMTSGTTGAPRAAMVRQRNVISFLRETTHLVPGDVPVSWMPPWHDFGLVGFIISCVFAGAGCHMLAPSISSIPDWLRTISRVGGTVTGGPDFAYRLATRMVDPSDIDLSSLRAAFNGGEPVRWSTIEHFEERFSALGVICPTYGLAEATVGVTMHCPGEKRVIDERGNVSCGSAICGFEVRAGSDLDHPDEIVARGEPVFAGYLDAPDDTGQALRDGWLQTGDLGYLDETGQLYVLGRRASMLKRGGGVVAPRELEEAAQRVEGVRLAAATSVPDPKREEELIVVVVEAEQSPGGPGTNLARQVSRAVADRVGFAPNRVQVVPPRSIPRTENGKIRHQRLQRALLELAGAP